MRYWGVVLLALWVIPAVAEDKKPVDQVTLWRGDAAITKAEELLKQKKFSESLDILDKIVARNIRNADAHVDSAIAWYYLGNMDKADASLKNALAIDRGHMGAYVMAGLVSLKKEDRNQAEYYLNALRVACQGDTCLEYITLAHALREYKEKDGGFF